MNRLSITGIVLVLTLIIGSLTDVMAQTRHSRRASWSNDTIVLTDSLAAKSQKEIYLDDDSELEADFWKTPEPKVSKKDSDYEVARLDRPMTAIDSLACDTIVKAPVYTFNPEPTRAVWLSALFPGLGQIYNRRYWKLPIVVGGFLGISYAVTWNNRMYGDYGKGYRDATDGDPSTKSYMDFFPKGTKESSLDMTWVSNVMKSRRDFYRRNRDLSVICMVGLYLLCMVDAYVDASLAHFDITPDLSMNIAPAIMPGTNQNGKPSVGLAWVINF